MIAATATYNSKADSLQIPTTWSELRAIGLSRQIITALLSLSPFHIQMAVAQRVLRKYPHDASHVTDVMSVLDFCDLRSLRDFDWSADLTLWIWGRYAMVRPHFDNGTIREFIMADDYLTKYVAALESNDATAATTHLYRCLATLLRPVNKDTATSIRLNDTRIPLTGRDQVERIAATLERDGKSLLYGSKIRYAATVAILTVLATKNFIAANYMPHLTSDDNSGDGGRSVNFGWHTIVMDIAENGAFGDMESVYNSQLHDVMVFCVKKANDAAAARAAADAAKTNNH